MTRSWHSPTRLRCENFAAVIDSHKIHFTVSRDGDDRVTEIAISPDGKVGSSLDQMMVDLGLAISRAIQRRDPTTGVAIT